MDADLGSDEERVAGAGFTVADFTAVAAEPVPAALAPPRAKDLSVSMDPREPSPLIPSVLMEWRGP